LQAEALEGRTLLSTVVLGTSKDNTLYQTPLGNISNGAGDSFFVGVDGPMGGFTIRRGVIAFDIADAIPAGSTINSVTLNLFMVQSRAGAETIELHDALADWGEGNSIGTGMGAPATTNDATWIYRFFNTPATWTNPGGDFTSTVSASKSVSGVGSYTWGSTPQMVADVQNWLDHPTNNFGWVVLGNEAGTMTAKRFGTKENSVATDRPTLTIDYTSVSTASTLQVSNFPSSVTAGTPGMVTVTAQDSMGHTVTNYTGTVHFTSSDPAVSPGNGLPADYTFTPADAGVHSFSATLTTAGVQSITATDTASGSITGTQGGITVSPAAPDHISFSEPATVTAGVPFQITVTIQDAFNNTVTGYTGMVHFTATNGAMANYTFTPTDMGSHTFTIRLFQAATLGVTGTDTVSGVSGGTSFTITPAAADHFVITGPSGVAAGQAFDFTVTVVDAFNNTVVGYTGTVHFTSSDSAPSLPMDYTFTAADMGTHTFPGGATLFDTNPMATLTASDTSDGTIQGTLTLSVQ
jgi:hypothetical protein